MARYIDADKLREYWIENGVNENVYNTNNVLDSIDYQPTADVVEVVRCEKCTKRIGESITGEPFCLIHEISVPYDYYCASGERRDT